MVTIYGKVSGFSVNVEGLGLRLSVEGSCENLKVMVRVSVTGYW